jgi:hypothetical protein
MALSLLDIVKFFLSTFIKFGGAADGRVLFGGVATFLQQCSDQAVVERNSS